MPGSVHVGFAVNKGALEQGFLRVLWLSSVSIIPPWVSILIYHLMDEQYGCRSSLTSCHSIKMDNI